MSVCSWFFLFTPLIALLLTMKQSMVVRLLVKYDLTKKVASSHERKNNIDAPNLREWEIGAVITIVF